MTTTTLTGHSLIEGTAHGTLLLSDVELSFWGGVDPASGEVIDQHHPLAGQNLAGKLLAIPGGRGSCTGSGVLLELIQNNLAPAALLFTEAEEILTLGVVVADVMFERSIPVLQISETDFSRLVDGSDVTLDNNTLTLSNTRKPAACKKNAGEDAITKNRVALSLTDSDQAMLNGEHGKATQVAMQILTRMATIQGATELLDITQAHIDSCVYNGPSGLQFASRLLEWGAAVRVPTTLNSLSVDQRRWQQHGIDPALGEPASKLGDVFMQMGAQMSFTCAPYLLDTAPAKGEQIVWAESNAVAFANSVLGARTQKYADFLDICIALTGRAPLCGSHLDEGRMPTLSIVVEPPQDTNDAYWPLLGYHIGVLAVNDLPIIYGLEHAAPDNDDLKAFSAAFATTSSTAMFHIAGITPEADTAHNYLLQQQALNNTVAVSTADLVSSWHELNSATESTVDAVCLGNPHFSLSECESLASLCAGRKKAESVRIIVTLGRKIHAAAESAGYVQSLEDFGVEFITDTCWCMLVEPVIPTSSTVLMTNSAKYAHYAPGLVKRNIYFDSLTHCVDAACSGSHCGNLPSWLDHQSGKAVR
ncbi:hypothetical protein AB833_11955 [Chromatiales bacterium (ex Bugula neritina AB1)]|nr:hypothetical protein AB833_11955 [Chromatiales bacterium (ex Bugula neritina AB1)]